MKKLSLVAFVIFMFIAYTVYWRHESDVSVGKPSSINQPGSSPAPTGSSGGTGSAGGSGQYKDGQYTGSVADAYYGNVQVRATVSGGRVTKVEFLQYPNDRSTSVAINTQAMPYLQQEAISAQNAQVDIVSGATDTSQAFIESLGAALSQAKS